ncbi:esterase/lipase family protein [Microbacterium gilvum]|uniref:Alpha/beta hydrolase n=1 Tax=Microbacterium gilvum TaxID=1336204 RepID=A0ABP9A8I7_9MICO
MIRPHDLADWAADYAYAVRRQASSLLPGAGADAYRDGYRAPVVVVPGVYESWRFLRPLIRAVHAHGHPVHVVDPLRSNRVPVAAGARLVGERIAERGLMGAVLLAHSKGGLVGKHAMSFGPVADRIAGMVAVAAPFGGSRYARLFLTRTLRAFSPRDATIRRLGGALAANERIVSISARFDPHIPEGSVMPGARNVVLDRGGHFRILADPAVLREVLDLGARAAAHA